MLPPPPAPRDSAPEPDSSPRSSTATAILRQSHFSIATLGNNLRRPLLPASSLTAAHPSPSQGQASELSQLTSVVDGMMYGHYGGGTGEDGGEDEASSCAGPAGASSFSRLHDDEAGAGSSAGWGASSSYRRTVTDDSATAAWRVSPQPLPARGGVGRSGDCDEAISKLGPALPRPSERPHALFPRAGSPALPSSERASSERARGSSVLLGSPLSAAVASSMQQQQRGSAAHQGASAVAGARRNLGSAISGQQQKGIGTFSLIMGKGQTQTAPEPPPVAVVSKMDILERLRKVCVWGGAGGRGIRLSWTRGDTLERLRKVGGYFVLEVMAVRWMING